MRNIYLIIYKVFFKNFINSDMPILGRIYKAMRSFLFKKYTKNNCKNINIQLGAKFGKNVELGDNSGIGERALISDYCKIGNDVMMGPEVIMYTRNHEFKNIDTPMYKQGFKEIKGIIIEDDVWIGARVIILPGVRVGKGSILGAGSVIARDVEPYSIMVGNPSYKVKSRK